MIGKALNGGNDIFVKNGSFATVEEGAQTVQHLRTRLRFYLGEWFLDLEAGVPYFQQILKKPFDIAKVETLLKSEILNTPDIEKLTRFESSFNGETRKLTINFDAETSYGIIEGVTINVRTWFINYWF